MYTDCKESDRWGHAWVQSLSGFGFAGQFFLYFLFQGGESLQIIVVVRQRVKYDWS